MSQVEDEPKLIAQAVAGDKSSLQLLLFQYRARLLKYITRHLPKGLRDHLEPQDIFQDASLHVVKSISEFTEKAPDSLERWLVTITRNLIADHVKFHRRAKRQNDRFIIAGAPDQSVVLLLEELALYCRTPSNSAASREVLAAVEQAINDLPPDQAEALRLHHLTGLEIRDIADRMHRTAGSVALLCYRAREAVRLSLASKSILV